MTHRCLSGEKLAEILASPADDGRRADVAACPRCAAHLAALATFLAGDPDLPTAEAAAADRALAGFTRDLVARNPPARAARPVAPGRSRRGFGLPRVRLAAAFAACAVVATVVILAGDVREPARVGERLRGGGAGATEPAVGPVTAVAREDGTVGLEWPPVAETDQYVVEVFTAELDTLRFLPPSADPRAVLDRTLLADPRAAGGILVKVLAQRGGATIAASPPQPLAFR